MELGDQKPNQLLRRMKMLVKDKVSDTTLRMMWTKLLPANVRSVIAISETISNKTTFVKCDNNGFASGKSGTVNKKFGGKRERYAGNCNLQLDVTTSVPFSFNRQSVLLSTVALSKNDCRHYIAYFGPPFMNNMDEIAYWVHTKRAPCLFGYDKTKKQNVQQAHCSKTKPKVNAVNEVPLPKKKNKRKLVLVDNDTYSSEKGQSGIFITSGDQQRHTSKNGKPAPSTSVGSDIDFNIKNSSNKVKPKRMKLHKSSKLSYVKKNNIVTSTPKVTTAVRRSLRNPKKKLNNNSELDTSFEVLNKTYPIRDLHSPQINTENGNTNKPFDVNNMVTESENIGMSDQNNEKLKNETVLNGQFEDMSDVSGFTANYIRSTKINSTKTPRNVRNKINKDFIKESQQSLHQEDVKMVICVNKSVNTGLLDSTILNCSTDSSQNVINLVTVKNCDKSTRVSRGTSLLKFLDPQSKESSPNDEVKPDINISYQSNSTSRYPTRRRNVVVTPIKMNNPRHNPDRRKGESCEINNYDRKENSEEGLVSRTRSGRKIGLQIRQPENSVLVLSNSTDQASSVGAVNVADPTEKLLVDDSTKRKRYSGRSCQSKKMTHKGRQSLKRDKSGFAECFSESDNDSELLKQRKFFC